MDKWYCKCSIAMFDYQWVNDIYQIMNHWGSIISPLFAIHSWAWNWMELSLRPNDFPSLFFWTDPWSPFHKKINQINQQPVAVQGHPPVALLILQLAHASYAHIGLHAIHDLPRIQQLKLQVVEVRTFRGPALGTWQLWAEWIKSWFRMNTHQKSSEIKTSTSYVLISEGYSTAPYSTRVLIYGHCIFHKMSFSVIPE